MTKRRRTEHYTVNTRVKEIPGEFLVDNGILYCNFCDHSIDWMRKSTVDDHLNIITHKNKKRLFENKKHWQQQTIDTTLSSSESKKAIIHDLIEAFTITDIPLEKVNFLLVFFKT
ncbi:CGG triplet repeat-binding protein 1 [Rhizophagus irregularis DAOM 181602=DAOM 197198]|uniref:Uncharacterized protein n=2 Tax=Rhizophagus irregularis TaxID=588596 RepID=A0A015LIP8_RHIIW|nr:hypothetical protein RirG_232400 [Rhizophagus irregularis DAOM 197198w]GBC18570.1 CGG triplet repeat-binding protein 1 [Rhizophagus irregularis DAOM 181602=DAOM 197198]